MHVLRDAGFDVVGAVARARHLVRMARVNSPDVVIADIQMPPITLMTGCGRHFQIRATKPGTGVLVLSQFLEDSYVFDLVADGA